LWGGVPASDNGEGRHEERQRPQDIAQVRADVPASGRHLRPQAGRQELDGPRRRRHHRRALGQLQEQTDVRLSVVGGHRHRRRHVTMTSIGR